MSFAPELAHRSCATRCCASRSWATATRPNEYRADTVRNLDAWYAAFDVKPSQKLYLAPADRVKVW